MNYYYQLSIVICNDSVAQKLQSLITFDRDVLKF